MKGYGSFCPVSKAAEILTERWTLLVLRELLLGSCHFNHLRRGIPQMSPTPLSKRLQTLEGAGLVSRESGGNGHWEYHPTQAAEELGPIIEAVGHWGQRWARRRLIPDELDAGRLMWNMRRSFNMDSMPPGGLVLYTEIIDARLRRWWFVARDGEVDLCWDDPGFDVDITLYASLLTLVKILIATYRSRAHASSARSRYTDRRILSGACRLGSPAASMPTTTPYPWPELLLSCVVQNLD